MKPLSTNEAMWLVRGVALGRVLRLMQLEFRASVRRLRHIRLPRRLREIGIARRRLPEG